MIATEVPAAYTLDDCWKLVETAERQRKHCVMLEQANYSQHGLTVLEMAQKGVFGQLFCATGGYVHDLRLVKFDPEREPWRLQHSVDRNGNLLVLRPDWTGVRDQLLLLSPEGAERQDGEAAAVRRVGHAQDGIRVPAAGAHFLACRQIPQLCGGVFAARQGVTAIRREGDGEDLPLRRKVVGLWWRSEAPDSDNSRAQIHG